jgi:hypothetical protein
LGAGEISLNFRDIAHTISNSRQRDIPYNGIAFGSLRERFKFCIFLVWQLEGAPRIAPHFTLHKDIKNKCNSRSKLDPNTLVDT